VAEDGTNPVEVRRARPADAPAIARVFIDARRTAMPWLAEPYGWEETVAYFLQLVQAGIELHVAVDRGGLPIAFIGIGEGEVEHLYVAPVAQGRRLGSRLLALAQEGRPALELWVFQRNAGVRAFYERHGFRLVETTDGSRNVEREPDARYRWQRG
jgi:ribosomal protein S18 acetylase RimI-like enzyme